MVSIKKISEGHITSLYSIGLHEFKGDLWFTKRFLADTIRTPGFYFGAFEKDRLLGGILVRRFDRPKLWIFFLAVDKRHRRLGIGTRLLDAVEKKTSSSYPLIFVDIQESMQDAKKFYLRHGFKRKARIDDWFGIGEEGVIYSKRIS